MNRRRIAGAAAGALACLAAACSPAPSPPAIGTDHAAGASPGTIVIDNARVFDGERDLGVVALVIRDGLIERIVDPGTGALPAGAERIDYQGRFIMPGLVSAHAHVGNTRGTEHGDRFFTRDYVVRDLRQFQAYGVTTVNALGLNGDGFAGIRDEVAGQPALGA